VSRLHASHSFGAVLALVVVSVLFTAFAPETSWTGSVLILLQAATLALALWTSGLGRTAVRGAVGLAVVATAVATVQLFGGGSTEGATGLFSALLIVMTCAVIGVGVVDQGKINAQSVIGVVTIYLLIGLFFTFAYSAIATLGDGAFFAQGTDGTAGERIYFSYVTLATLGYGDFTAAGQLGRMLAVGEALLGQLYLVTVVAVVVGHLRPRRAS
jgi:Ion channel